MARAVVELAIDRELPEAVEAFVRPLDAFLRKHKAGLVQHHQETPLLTIVVRLKLSSVRSMDLVLQCLAETGAPTGTVVYRRNWLGRKTDLFVLGPEEEPDAQ